MSAIREAVDAARSEFSMADVSTPGNDLTVVHVHGRRNHGAPSIQRLFEVVAQQAPASYGLKCLTHSSLRVCRQSSCRTIRRGLAAKRQGVDGRLVEKLIS